MKKHNLLMLAALAVTPLMAQDAKQIAESLTMPEIKAGMKQLPMPKADGAKIEILGADYEQLIDSKGHISPVIEDTPVNISFKVSKDGKEEISKDYEVLLKAPAASQGNPKPTLIPELLQWKGREGSYSLPTDISVLWGDQTKAGIFAKELKDVTGKSVKVLKAKKGDAKADITCRLVKNDATLGKEGYKLSISPKGVEILANTEQGLFWGTRSVLQMLRQDATALPCGVAVDIPRYQVRGFMLDIARTPYPLSYLKDVINAMAWYKMNDLHLVINNNYIFAENYVDKGHDPMKESYSAFRLESPFKGPDGTPLTAQDLSYSKKEFADLVHYAAERGVTIVPEFDTPGHALSFTRVRPDLIYQGKMAHHEKRRCEMLDAANPETLKFVANVLDEYLVAKNGKKATLEECPVIHVGSDEFFGEAEDYRRYADGMLKYAKSRNKTPRIWGSLSSKPGKTPVESKGVQMNLWSNGWMNPWQALEQGYDVINTNDGALYIVPFANYYRMDQNHKGVYENWLPNKVGGDVLPSGHPQLLGATFAIWNDMTDLKHNGYAPVDIWDIVSGSMDVLSQKMWGKVKNPDSFEEHRELVKKIGNAPASNPLHEWKNKEELVVTPFKLPHALKKPALGGNYRLTAEVELAEAPQGQEQVLLSGPEGKLIAVMKDGTVGFRRDDSLEFSFGTALPVGKKVKLELIGEPKKTRLLIDGQEAGMLRLNSYKDADDDFKPKTKDLLSTFTLPLETVGESLKGKVHSLSVKPE